MYLSFLRGRKIRPLEQGAFILAGIKIEVKHGDPCIRKEFERELARQHGEIANSEGRPDVVLHLQTQACENGCHGSAKHDGHFIVTSTGKMSISARMPSDYPVNAIAAAILLLSSFTNNIPVQIQTPQAAVRVRKSSIENQLSPREEEVLECLVQGFQNKMIGSILGITEGTVKTHVKSILRKTETSNRTRLALWASERGYGYSRRERSDRIGEIAA